MKTGELFATGFLAFGFIVISVVMLFIEPGMGFEQASDFYDPEKVLFAAATPVWLIGDLIFFAIALSLIYLTATSSDVYLKASGIVAGTLFFLIGNLGRVLDFLPAVIDNAEQLQSTVVALVSIRFAVLRSAVFAFGVFAWRATLAVGSHSAIAIAWKILGCVALIAGTIFLFWVMPIPVLFAFWSLCFVVQKIRTPVL